MVSNCSRGDSAVVATERTEDAQDDAAPRPMLDATLGAMERMVLADQPMKHPKLNRLEEKSEVSKAFEESQVQLTKSMLSTCDTEDELRERITASYDYPKSACPYGQDWITKLASEVLVPRVDA